MKCNRYILYTEGKKAQRVINFNILVFFALSAYQPQDFLFFPKVRKKRKDTKPEKKTEKFSAL